MLLDMRQETEGHFLLGTMILGFLSIFKSQTSSPFEAMNSVPLLSCQRDVRPPVQMGQRPRVFSMVFTRDSDIPSSCEMNDEPPLKALQAIPAFFRVRASRGPFHLRKKAQGPSHIPITEGKLLLRCLCKVGLPLQSKTGNQLSSRDDMGCTELSSNFCTEIEIPLDLRRVSQGNSGVFERTSSHLMCMMWNAGWIWNQCRGNGLHLEFIWSTHSYFAFLR